MGDPNEKKIRFRLSPELVDGDHWTVVDTTAQLLEAVKEWAENNGTDFGESFTVETVEMSDAEVRALPEI